MKKNLKTPNRPRTTTQTELKQLSVDALREIVGGTNPREEVKK